MNRKDNMTRKQALNAYNRTRQWEQRQSKQLREEVLVKYFAGMLTCLHNWMIAYDKGNKFISPEAYKAGKRYNYRQQQIWTTAGRLQKAFGKYF